MPRKMLSPSQVQERGEIYWLRITSFVPGATLSLNGENAFPIDALTGHVCPLDKPWKQFDLTGTVNVEYSSDPREPYPGAANPTSVTSLPSGSGLTAYGRSVAPGAGVAVATIAAPGAGFYDIEVETSFGLTVAAGDEDNMQLQIAAGVVNKLIAPPIANQQPNSYRVRRVAVLAGQAITVNAVGAATAGAIYKAMISIVQVS